MLQMMPSPYEDELFYGWISRYIKQCGYTNSIKIINSLFGINYINPNPLVPINLAHFISQLPSNFNFSKQFIIENYTIIPFSRFFIKQSDYKILENEIMVRTKRKFDNITGFRNGDVADIKVIKVCTHCMDDDRKMLGEAFVHRAHQVPGNLICLKHMKFLKEIRLNHKSNRNKFFNINDLDLYNDNQEKVIPIEIINLSKDIESIINMKKNDYSLEVLLNKYGNILRIKGYQSAGGLIFRNKLINDFKEYYSEDLLNKLNSNPKADDEHNWISNITKNKCVVHPVRHLLLIRFLFGGVDKLLSNEEEFRPFGKGPWPCMNPISNHYKVDVITKCTVYMNKHTGKVNGKFYCDCGFIYTRKESDNYEEDKYNISQCTEVGSLWEAKLKELVEQPTYTITEIAGIMHCSSETVIRHSARLGISDMLNTKSKVKWLRDNANENLLEFYKHEIEEHVRKHPNKSKTQILEELNTAYRYVIKKDKGWINNLIPRSRITPINRFDYLKKDSEVKEIVIRAINELLRSEIPIKITRKVIARKCNYSLLTLKVFTEKLPCTDKIIEKSIETNEQFKVRKLKYIVKMLLENHEKLNKSNIAKHVTITMDEYIKLEPMINDIALEYSND